MRTLPILLLFICISCERETSRDIDSLTGTWGICWHSQSGCGTLYLIQKDDKLSGELDQDINTASYLVGTVSGDSIKFDVYNTNLMNGFKFVTSFEGKQTYETSELYSQSMRGVVTHKEPGRKDNVWDYVAYKIIEK